MAELVDALGLGSSRVICGGSSPLTDMNIIKHTPFIFEYENFVTPEDCDHILNQVSKLRSFEPNIKKSKNGRDNNAYHIAQYSNVEGNLRLFNYITAVGQSALIQYYRDNPYSKYNIIEEWGVMYNYVYRYYDKNDHYNWHVDKSGDHVHFVVSFLLYLNDDFEGGNTLFLHDRLKVKPKKGSVLMFPCGPYFLHKGTKVTSGQKHVIWNCFGQTQPASV
jgi:hypothetical protein